MKKEQLRGESLRRIFPNGWFIAAGLLWMLVAAASCSDETTPVPSDESVPIEVTTSLDAGMIETRAATIVSSGSIGVFVGNANGYTPQYNIQYTYSDGGWKASNPVYVKKANASLCAYYDPNSVVVFPANSTVTQSVLTAQKYDETKLWYYATTGGSSVCYATPQARFDMIQAYARLKLSIQRHATNYLGNCSVTNVNIKSGTGFINTATFDIVTGTVTGTTATVGFTYALNSGNIAAGATYTGYDVLLPPQSVANGLTITLTVDGNNCKVVVPAAQFSEDLLKSGNQYTVNLLIKDTEVTISGAVQVNDFGAGNTVTNLVDVV